MSNKVGDGITYPFLNFNGATVEVKEWISNFIQHIAMDVITYLAGINDDPRVRSISPVSMWSSLAQGNVMSI